MIDLLRNRAIAAAIDLRHETERLRMQERFGATPARIDEQRRFVAKLQGQSAGALFALREAELDQAVAS